MHTRATPRAAARVQKKGGVPEWSPHAPPNNLLIIIQYNLERNIHIFNILTIERQGSVST